MERFSNADWPRVMFLLLRQFNTANALNTHSMSGTGPHSVGYNETQEGQVPSLSSESDFSWEVSHFKCAEL